MRLMREGYVSSWALSGDEIVVRLVHAPVTFELQLDPEEAALFRAAWATGPKGRLAVGLSLAIGPVDRALRSGPKEDIVGFAAGPVARGGGGGTASSSGPELSYPILNGIVGAGGGAAGSVACTRCSPPRLALDVADLAEAAFITDDRVEERIRQQLGIRAPYADMSRWRRRAVHRALDGHNPEHVWLIEAVARAERVAAFVRRRQP